MPTVRTDVLSAPTVQVNCTNGNCVVRVADKFRPTRFVDVFFTAHELWQFWCSTFTGPPPVTVADLPDLGELPVPDLPELPETFSAGDDVIPFG